MYNEIEKRLKEFREEALTCQICKEPVEKPLLCPNCRIPYCKTCLTRVSKGSKDIKCAFCRCTFKDNAFIKGESFLQNIIEAVHCIENTEKCKLHNKNVEYYCKSCRQPICSDCLVDSIQGHPFGYSHPSIKIEEFEKARQKYQQILSQIESRKNDVKENISNIKNIFIQNCSSQIEGAKKKKEVELDILYKVAQGISKRYDEIIELLGRTRANYVEAISREEREIERLNEMINYYKSIDIFQIIDAPVLDYQKTLAPIQFFSPMFPFLTPKDISLSFNVLNIPNFEDGQVFQKLEIGVNFLDYTFQVQRKKIDGCSYLGISFWINNIDFIEKVKYNLELTLYNPTNEKKQTFKATEEIEGNKEVNAFNKIIEINKIESSGLVTPENKLEMMISFQYYSTDDFFKEVSYMLNKPEMKKETMDMDMNMNVNMNADANANMNVNREDLQNEYYSKLLG